MDAYYQNLALIACQKRRLGHSPTDRHAMLACVRGRFGCHKNLHAKRRMDHNAAAILAIRAAGVSAAKRIVSPPLSSSTPGKLIGVAGRTSSGLEPPICPGTKSMLSKLGKQTCPKTSLPIRVMRRQSETLRRTKPYRLATPFTAPPSISVSATIHTFSSRGHCHLPSELRGSLARNTL